ncbi:branched-chain amino acid ABC transporter permease [Amycolatopsis pithecellobii]|uniref:Branched-chain amino acid ABC transporter permease n=1 Tax=Amycolatopsis pithecellobii TaxID=664692 RepID=A0A6N7YPN8_9PSEU|nr:branched-chain amino acid ABC transporter permease [Amycolatopsis pithecellobii]MTD54967.1 branched-chain amino acid ABC transporter permease [Amycolatopsis pithecellobii]
MNLFLQQLVNGLSTGALYALFAIGFGIIFANMGILNVAHGTFATWGVVAAYELVIHTGLPFVVAVPAAAIAAGAIGLLAETFAFRPLREKNAGLLGSIIVAVGVWIILLNLAEVVLGPDAVALPDGVFPTKAIAVAGLQIPPIYFVNVLTLAVVAIGLGLFLSRTRFGAAIRAVGFKPESAAIAGVNARLALGVTAVIAAGIAGVAGILTAATTNNVSFNVGEGLLLKGFAAVVIGGFGNLRGAVLGGLAIGIIEIMTVQYLSTTFREAIVFGLLLVFLVARPQGIFGEVKVSRA